MAKKVTKKKKTTGIRATKATRKTSSRSPRATKVAQSSAIQLDPGSVEKTMKEIQRSFDKIRAEISKVIVGQDEVVEQLLVAISSRGHCILEGVPGLAKTLLISTLAKCLDLNFHRIQFTPDLMPADITGTEIIHEDRASGNRVFRFLKGPVFANVVLADEINRTPPKTQAALLEAMQEKQVTVGGECYPLPSPFFVLATQNPIEQEGTYPLPEAQQDRFMFKVYVKYPDWQEEREVIRRTTSDLDTRIDSVLASEDIERIQKVVRQVPVADSVLDYALKLVRQTRLLATTEDPKVASSEGVPDFVKESVAWGAGPRACQFLIIGAKAKALLSGRHYVSIEDIQSMSKPVLRHRILTNFHAEARGVDADQIIEQLLKITPTDEGAILPDGQLRKVLRS